MQGFFDIDQYLARLTKSRKRQRLIKTAVLSLLTFLLLMLIIIGFKLSSIVAEPLSLIITPNEVHIITTQGTSTVATLTMGTNNYLFCTATCSYELEDLSSGKRVAEGSGIRLKDSTRRLLFSLVAPERGEGVITYRLHVTCQNEQ
ncbi:hypothetical protein D6789_04040, partial [Candidatus Woesearchaeota archaeon]